MKNSFVFTLSESSDKLSLKKILVHKLSGAVFLDGLSMKLILLEGVHISLVDDLLDYDICKSRIEIVLNESSSINYRVKILENKDSIDFEQDCNRILGYDQQGAISKDLNFKFVGEYSRADVSCSVKGTSDRVIELKTIQDHQASFTASDLVVKSAMCQESKLICDNIIRVSESVEKIQAIQLNKNLLLGCDSRVITAPRLEIESDDVDCKHGAAVSQLDEEQIFFLQSRGLDYCQAKNALIEAFLN